MRYGAKIQDGIVTDVAVLQDGTKGDEAVDYFRLIEQGGIRPGIGWSWDGAEFRPPSPFPSWSWDGAAWQPPTPAPDGPASWDEDAQAWVPVA